MLMKVLETLAGAVLLLAFGGSILAILAAVAAVAVMLWERIL